MAEEDSTVASVSSLRSRFEQMISPTTPAAVDWDPQRGRQQISRQAQPQRNGIGVGLNREQELRDPFAEPSPRRLDGRVSLDLAARDSAGGRGYQDNAARDQVESGHGGFSHRLNKWGHGTQAPTSNPVLPTRPAVPKQRPLSMGVFTQPCTTPILRVDSPKSPPQQMLAPPSGIAKSKTPPLPPAREAQRISRPPSPSRDSLGKMIPPVPPNRPSRPSALSIKPVDNAEYLNEAALSAPIPRSSARSPGMHTIYDYNTASGDKPQSNEVAPTPPPIPNRPERYKATGRKPPPPIPPKRSDNLTVAPASSDERVSPFSTPPSSPDRSHGSADELPVYLPGKNASKRVSVPAGTFPPPPPPPSLSSHPRMPIHTRAPIASPGVSRAGVPAMNSRGPILTRASIDSSELRPTLPPRPKAGIFSLSVRKNSLRGRSASPPRVSTPPVPASQESRPQMNFQPPPQRSHTLKGRSISGTAKNIRSVSGTIPSTTSQQPDEATGLGPYDSDDEAIEQDRLSEYPDVSQANRRRPVFKVGPHEIPCKSDIRLIAVSGQYVCTASHSTRVWNVSTGECIMTLSHGEGTKITAIAFKPAVDVHDEGTVLWLGTSNGELLEVDIAAQRVVETRGSAHMKREVIKIHRHRNELWTLDDGGKLQVWGPDPNGIPNLRNSPTTFRIPNKHTYSLVVGSQLWVGAGRTVYVYNPSPDSRSDIMGRPITPSKPTGEITCGTLVNSEPDKVFFGHSDGKVSIYSRSTLQCIDVVSVSLYKINSMAGVGDYLWAGFKTGMMYVYDVRTSPWRAIKDWQAHGDPIEEVLGDRTSIWKIDRLQVISVGADNCIKVWDGMLEEDWLEARMAGRDVEFCDFREIKTVICTWNAGASKPQDLLKNPSDAAFLENVLTSIDSPDIIVFGFQELVDLEDKKLTAKTFLKGGKKKRAQATQERMSHQYRLWQQQLTKSIEQFMPRDESYVLLHSASLVGLFTCIFIKMSERNNIRNVAAATVKRGLGGLHGNKGALIIRFLLDDTSLCFINCHLAAGQSHTISRNNDIAAILESSSLPPEQDRSVRSDIFVGGGDGSMILDHEICVLNGDLNYRIDGHRDSVIQKVKQNELDFLLEKDQLLVERKRNPGFRLRSFNESPIRFAPTYKYDVGTDTYDSSEKKRVPAWCDRLLYRGMGKIKQLEYRRHEVRVSDHRPVSGTFMLRLKTVSPRKRAAIWETCVDAYKQAKKDMLYNAKLDYLISVCGYEREEAERLMNKKTLPAAIKALQA